MQTLEQLRQQMIGLGVTRLLMKSLSPNDNSKNQVYLDGSFGVLNLIPAAAPRATSSGSEGKSIFKAALSFSWLDSEGRTFRAPAAQLILYPQYPEVRFSGFLNRAEWAPSEIMRSRDPGRVLFFGIKPNGEIIGFADSGESPIARALADIRGLEKEGVFLALPIGATQLESQTRLLRELCRVARLGWIDPWRLDASGARLPCNGTNCIGVTLESELGITANGRSEPDLDGWEIKGHTVANLERPGRGVVTLLTPEPTDGLYATEGAEAFVRRYGYADLRGREDRINFGGIHRVGVRAARTGLSLHLDGFDATTGKITNAFGALRLVDSNDEIAAAWSFQGLLKHWTRKHAKAAFVPAVQRNVNERQYRFGERVLLAEGTDYSRLLAAIAAGTVYLDPGIKIEAASTLPKVKRRNQFRVNFRDLPSLYHAAAEHVACAS